MDWVPPPPGWGTPPPPIGLAWTGYVAGGTPLAVFRRRTYCLLNVRIIFELTAKQLSQSRLKGMNHNSILFWKSISFSRTCFCKAERLTF